MVVYAPIWSGLVWFTQSLVLVCVSVGDKLPKGAPELMMTPQGVLRPELVKFRDDKCFALNIMTVEMNRNEQFP